MKYILSFGGGVNSTALLFFLIDNNFPLDEIIFADTGAELPETYKHINKIQEFCKRNKIKFTIVKNEVGIYEWYWKHKKIPTWNRRSCTDIFKIRPIRRYLKERYSKEKFVMYIGISYDERQRAKKSNVKYIKNRYPLIENGIDRKRCEKIIISHGFKVPPKSGCYFCPFQPEERWEWLLKNYPLLFQKAKALEENGSAYPKLTLSRRGPLKNILLLSEVRR